MAGSLGSLSISIEANMARFQSEMSKSAYVTEQAMTKMQKSADATKAAMSNMAAGAVGTIASLVGVSQAIDVMTAAIDRMDKFDELSERMAISTKTLQEFAYAGKMTGVDLDTMAGSIKKLQVSLFDANTGGKESAAVYKALGVSINDANGNLRSAPDVMGDLAEVFANLSDGSTKTALAIKLFGKSGADMVPFLSAGRDGIKEMTDEANRLGGVMGGDALKAAAAFNDNLDRLSTSTQAAANSLTSTMIPAINDVINRFIEGRKAGMGFWESLSATSGMTVDRATGESYGKMIADVNKEIERTHKLVEQSKGNPAWVQSMFSYTQKDIDALERKKVALQAMQRNVALAGSEGGANEDQNDRRARVSPGSADSAVARALRESNTTKTSAARTGKTDAQKLEEDAAKFIARLKEQAETLGMSGAALVEYQAKLAGFSEPVRKQSAIFAEQIETFKRVDEARKDKIKAEEEAIAATQKNIAAQFESIAALQREAETYDMLPAAITRAEIAKLELHRATLEVNEGTEQEIKVTEALIAAKQRLANSQDVRAGMDQQRDEAKKAADDAQKAQDKYMEITQKTLGDGFYDAMNGKFKNIGDSFKALMMKMTADALAANLTKTLFGGNGVGALGGGLGGLLAKWGTIAGAGGASSATGGLGIMGDVIVPSAAGGFDIPAGSNPMTQLHEKEMVLPKQHADVIRGLANSGGTSSASISLSPVYNIQIDSRSDRAAIQADVQRAVANGNAQLVDQLSRAGRI